MTDKIVERICTWNYVRDNIGYDEELEYDMLFEEIEEYGVSRDLDNQAKELADIVFVAIGSLYKMTGSPSRTKEILDIVISHNDNKGTKKDKNGKIQKVKQEPCEPKIHKVLQV